jgi:putative DNA primase/helicase
MAYRLANSHRDDLLHVHGIGWHYWDGARWASDDIGAAKRAALNVLRLSWNEAFQMQDKDAQKRLISDIKRCESNAGIAGMLAVASALSEFASTVRAIDADPYVLNVANGTLDLHTLQLRDHAPIDRITKVCRGAYEPGVKRDKSDKSQLWLSVLERVLPDEEVRKYLQRVIGMSLIGELREHILSILNGSGRNGKSTVFEAILYSLGDYACMAEPDLLLHRDYAHPTGQMDLRGRRLVIMSEIPKESRMNEVLMKRLTGDRLIKARGMRQDFVEFPTSHTPVMVANFLPKMSGDDNAAWERVSVVPFDVYIPASERNPGLGAELQLEADGVLSWAVDGLQDYLENGLKTPKAVLVKTDKYRLDNDDVGRWMKARCVTDEQIREAGLGTAGEASRVKATSTDLHDNWRQWQSKNDCPELGLRAFGMILDNKGYSNGPSVHGKRYRKGIGLKAKDKDD